MFSQKINDLEELPVASLEKITGRKDLKIDELQQTADGSTDTCKAQEKELKEFRQYYDDRPVGGVNSRGRVVNMEGKELLRNSRIPAWHDKKQWDRQPECVKEIETATYLNI